MPTLIIVNDRKSAFDNSFSSDYRQLSLPSGCVSRNRHATLDTAFPCVGIGRMPALYPGPRRCSNCRYFAAQSGTDGQCRRFPPQLVAVDASAAQSAFPVVAADQWCGWHRQAMQAPARLPGRPRVAGKRLDEQCMPVLQHMRDRVVPDVGITIAELNHQMGFRMTDHRLLRLLEHLEHGGYIVASRAVARPTLYSCVPWKNSDAGASTAGGAQ